MPDTPPLLSVRERKILHAPNRQRQRIQTPLTPVSARFRAHMMSPEHHAMLRENIRKYREANGGKAAVCKGVANGWAGLRRRAKRDKIIAMAKQKAKEAVAHLVEEGRVKKDEAGNAVLAEMATIVLAIDPEDDDKPCYSVRDRMQAAKMVLDFTMTKPEVKTSVTVTAESFLDGILATASQKPTEED